MDSFNASNLNFHDDTILNRTRMLLGEIGNQHSSPSLIRTPNSASQQMLMSKSSYLNQSTMSRFGVSNHQPIDHDSSRLNFTQTFDDQQKESQSSIFTEFKLKSDEMLDQSSNFKNLLNSYEAICAEQANFIRDQLNSYNAGSARHRQELVQNYTNQQDELEKEKELWSLLRTLYFDEYKSHDDSSPELNDDFDEMMTNESDDLNYGVNEALLIRHLEKKNPLFRRIKLIIEWLERIAANSSYMKSIKEKISSFQERCISWEHTLHHLKNLNKKIQYSSREYVTELDPDAPIRQGKPLNDLDQEDEYRLMEYVFAFIRAGDINAAKELCFKVGQSWRAATLEGYKLYSDDNFGNAKMLLANRQQQDIELKLNDGNLNRDIWRLIVHKLVKDDHFNKYEKASYAVLAGVVGPVLPVCRSYSDFVWAYLKAVQVQLIEREIRTKMPFREFTNLPYDSEEDNLFNKLTSSQVNHRTLIQLFDRINVLISNTGTAMSGLTTSANDGSSSSSSTGIVSSVGNVTNIITAKESAMLKADLQKPFSVILKHTILSGLDGFKSGTDDLMEYLKTILNEHASLQMQGKQKQNGNLLRFASHLSLFFKTASLQIKNDLFVQINEKYVQYLIDKNYKELIAYYLSHLPSQYQIKYYSKFLQNITEKKERLMLLNLAKERNMDVQAITLNIVDSISKQQQPNENVTTSNVTLLGQTTMINRTQIISTNNNATFTVRANETLSVTSSLGFMPSAKSSQQLNDEDKSKINALEWIVYDQMQRFKLLEYANLTMRYFLLRRQNFEATKMVFSKIPGDTLTLVLAQYNCSVEAKLQQIIDMLPRNVSNSIKEYLCFKEYIEAICLYNEWFEFFHKEKPQKPNKDSTASGGDINTSTSVGGGAGDGHQQQPSNFAERIAFDYQLKQYEDHLARWYAKALQSCMRVKVKFSSVLKFPNGGWMRECVSDDLMMTSGSESDLVDDEDEINVKRTSNDYISSDDDDDAGERGKQRMEDDEDMRCDDDDNDKSNESSLLFKKRREADQQQQQEEATDVNDARERARQMRELRKVYLPSIFFLMADMLNKMELYDEVIRLSDLIAAKHYNLVNLFTNSQLKSILNKISDASISLLDKNRDYLGYDK